jgi:acetyl-CoA carboxylase carboxyl transferase subunit beta
MRELFRRQPKFTSPVDDDARANVPDDLWVKCPKCGELAYTKEHIRALRVCQRCNHHFRLSARERIGMLGVEFVEWDAELRTADPLQFGSGSESYPDRARKAAAKAGVNEAIVSGLLTIEDHPTAVVVTDFAFMGASMGSVYGEKLTRACERAIEQRLPLLTISASGGARMQEGLFSLMQMAKTTTALARLGDARLPHLSLLTDPCYGGVSASYATVADVVLAEPGALIGFAGPRVIEQITRQKLPAGFQTAEFLLKHGLLDVVVPRRELATTLGSLIELYAGAHQTRRTRKQRAEALAAPARETVASHAGAHDGA